MQRISITNPQNIIDGTAKKYYFKLRNTGGPKGDKGEKGDTGATGPQGPQGDPCTVVVNSTATLEPGSNAYVTNTGSLSNAVLNFGIPKGDRGPQGAKGDKGDTGAKGDTGPRGPQGERGTNATVYVGTTSTLAPGSQATVYNSGSDSNAVLNFGIPQGAKGDTGSQGPQGPAGQNFAPTIVAELPATGDESKLYLTPKNYTTGTATGNPITISLGEDAGQIDSLKLDGDTFQQSYTGRNLLQFVPQSGQGMTTTYDMETGMVHVSGTNSSHDGKWSNISETVDCSLPAGTYSFSVTEAQSNLALLLRLIYQDGTTSDFYIPKNSTSLTFTTTKDATRMYIWYGDLTPAYSSVDFTVGLQLEAGSEATSFEPYVGGQASPSPSYPQQVQTVTGEQTITVVGKNRLNPQEAVVGTIDANTGEIVPWSGNTNMAGQEYIEVEPNTEYTIRAGTQFYFLRISEYTSDKANITRAQIADNTSLTITTTPNTKYIRWSANYRSIAITNPPQLVTDTQMQIEKGAYSSYTPYHATSYPINIGKNLIDMSQTWVRGTLNNSSVEVQPNNNTILSDYIKVEPNTTYVFSQKQLGGKEVKPNVVSFFKDKVNARTGFVVILNSSPQAFTTSNDTCYIRVGYYNSTGLTLDTWLDYVTDLQLEAGSQATTYAPYKTPIELCKLGDYQDYIYKDGDDWKVHKATNKITVDGSENWIYPDSGTNYTFFQFSRNNFKSKYGDTYDFYANNEATSTSKSDNFLRINASAPNMRTEQGFGFSGDGGGWLRISVPNTIATTADAFKTWLSSHPTTIDYALATPTDTAITDQTLIAQLEAIRTASLQASNTIINTATGSNLAGDMELGYYEFDPTNRYDKWLWLDINNNYEKLGS